MSSLSSSERDPFRAKFASWDSNEPSPDTSSRGSSDLHSMIPQMRRLTVTETTAVAPPVSITCTVTDSTPKPVSIPAPSHWEHTSRDSSGVGSTDEGGYFGPLVLESGTAIRSESSKKDLAMLELEDDLDADAYAAHHEEDLRERYETLQRSSLATHAIEESRASAQQAKKRIAYVQETTPFSSISQPVFEKIRQLQASISERVTTTDSEGILQQQLRDLTAVIDDQMAFHLIAKNRELDRARAECAAAVQELQDYKREMEQFSAARIAMEGDHSLRGYDGPISNLAGSSLMLPTFPKRPRATTNATSTDLAASRRNYYGHMLSVTTPTPTPMALSSSSVSRRLSAESGAPGLDASCSLRRTSLLPRFSPSSNAGSTHLTASINDALLTHCYFVTEYLACLTHAQQIRLFLVNDQNTPILAAAHPRSEGQGREDHAPDLPTLDDIRPNLRRWARPVKTAIARNMAVIAHSPKAGPGSEGERGVLCCMCWPIRLGNAPSKAIGAIEIINKRDTKASPLLPRYGSEDEAFAMHAALALGTLLSRFPISHQALSSGTSKNISRFLSAAQLAAGIVDENVPEKPIVEEIRSAETILNRAQLERIVTPTFRGTMATLQHRPHLVEKVAASSSEGLKKEDGSSSPPTATGQNPAWLQPSQIMKVDYAMESLESMWKEQNEENRAMHQQCRYWSKRVRDLSDMVRCFHEVAAAAKQMKSVEEMAPFLKNLDMAARTTNVDGFLSTLTEVQKAQAALERTGDAGTQQDDSHKQQQHHVERPVTSHAPTPADTPKARLPCRTTAETVSRDRIIRHVEEGPPNIRTFTVDPADKRQQQRDIASVIDIHQQTVAQLGDALQATLSGVDAFVDNKGFSASTSSYDQRRTPRRRSSWEIDESRKKLASRGLTTQKDTGRVSPRQQPTGGLQLPPPLFRVPAPPRDGSIRGNYGVFSSSARDPE